MKKVIYSLLGLFLATTTVSCSSDDDGPSNPGFQPQIKVKSVTQNGRIGLQAKYDSNGRYASVGASDGEILSFSYNPFNISSSYFQLTDIKLTSQNNIESMTVTEDGEDASYFKATYNSDGTIAKILIDLNGVEYTRNFTWRNGLLMKITHNVEGDHSGRLYDYDFEYGSGAVNNKYGQWTTMLSQAVGENDLLLPLTFCGFLGNAPVKLPSIAKMTYERSNGSSTTETMTFSYTLNSNGSISKESADGITLDYNY